MGDLIYLDNSATTKIDERVLDAMLPYLKLDYGNPASTHMFGSKIRADVEKARGEISKIIECESSELIFTSGATESLNIAIKGIALKELGKKNKLITVTTEHKAVLQTFKYLEQIGFEVHYLSVDVDGLINLTELVNSIDSLTIAVCVMYVNNETGVIQPIEEIAKICRSKSTVLICDATQAVGKIPIEVKKAGIDLLAFSPHKFHGPKGIGALYISNKIQLEQIIHGGGHENGYRSGTMNVPSIIGFAKACIIASGELKANQQYIHLLREKLEEYLMEIPGTKLNGHPEHRCYNILNISFFELDANILIRETPSLAISNGSACTSSVFEPSHVLTAMGLNRSQTYGALRFSLSKYNTEEEIIETVRILREWVGHFKQNL